MKKIALAFAATLAFSVPGFADLSGSQDELRNSGSSNYSNGTSYEVHPNDLTESQNELRRNGRPQRPTYQSCEEAVFGTDFWWFCRQLNGQ